MFQEFQKTMNYMVGEISKLTLFLQTGWIEHMAKVTGRFINFCCSRQLKTKIILDQLLTLTTEILGDHAINK